jgi:hypothetical protein
MTLTRTRYKLPDYQQNDYIGSLCVTRAKREETKKNRLTQMLDELEGRLRACP